MQDEIRGYGLCECGCGEQTSIAPQTNNSKGWVRGEPIRFVMGHHRRLLGPSYVVEDHGYDTPCWIWRHTINHEGYPSRKRGSVTRLMHREFYERHVGPIPAGLVLDHLCRVRACVNPEHLEPVTDAENCRRGLTPKLAPAQVAEIRASRSSDRELATVYGVNATTIAKARSGRTWTSDSRLHHLATVMRSCADKLEQRGNEEPLEVAQMLRNEADRMEAA